jgi:hypothetical protein
MQQTLAPKPIQDMPTRREFVLIIRDSSALRLTSIVSRPPI